MHDYTFVGFAWLAAAAIWWQLSKEWLAASPKRFAGLVALTIGEIGLGTTVFLSSPSKNFLQLISLLTLLFAASMLMRDRQEMSALPKGTQVRRVVNWVKVLGIPVWRKVVNTEILPPEK